LSFFKENYPALEKYSFTNEFLVGYHHYYGGCFIIYQSSTNRELWCFESRHRILIHFSGNQNTYESGCHTRQPLLFLVGIIWITTHIIVMIIVAKIIKALLYVAGKSIGGAASAPIVAAFSPFSPRDYWLFWVMP
jgi:hypothetical protein